MSEEKILVVHHSPDSMDLLRVYFLAQGYQVTLAPDAESAFCACRRDLPGAVLVDAAIGHGLLTTLRRVPATSHLPVLFLADSAEDKIRALEEGANDYLISPVDLKELRLRVRNLIAIAGVRDLQNPLTGLPSGKLADRHILSLLNDGRRRWAVMWFRVDHLDSFIEGYGHAAGEDVLRFLASLLRAATKSEEGEESIYHATSDDLIVVTTPKRVESIVGQVFANFDREIRQFYGPSDNLAGYMTLVDRQGHDCRIPLMSLSVGVVTNVHRSFATLAEVRKAATQVCAKAGQMMGNSMWIDRRRDRKDGVHFSRAG